MSLPVLNSPKFTTTLPVSKDSIEYRAFLVKEEKHLIAAAESDNPSDVEDAMRQVIVNCTFNKIDIDSLSMVDYEWILIKLKERSKGKLITQTFECQNVIDNKKCKHVTTIESSTDEIRFVAGSPENKINLGDDIFVEMRVPTLKDVQSLVKGDDDGYDLILASIKSIFTDEEVFPTDALSQEDLKNFVDSMNTEQFSKLKDFVENSPRLELDVDFKCQKCGAEEKLTITGAESFFE